MSQPITNDNIYAVGSIMTAKEHPAVKLVIDSYNQRIYYCSVVDHPESKQQVYYERELQPVKK
jgi:hypothetical protein